MAKNADLGAAKTAKKDEFYTQLTDIEKEMRYYRKHFQGKTVLCNCDDPFESNFFKYFALNFNRLGLKKLIATCYYSSPIAGQQLQYGCDANGQMTFYFEDKGAEENKSKRPYKAVVTQVYDKMGDGGVDMLDVAELFRTGENELVELEGDGDFRSPECLDLLDESDIVVTNPPFSLFREYVATLAEHQKHFIIIGNVNALKYKEIFPYIISNQIWLGASIHSGDGRYIKQAYISGHEGQILSDIASEKLYLRHLPDSFQSGKHIDAARFVMITAAFEWEFDRLFPDGICKSKERVEAELIVSQKLNELIDTSSGKTKKIYKSLLKCIERRPSLANKIEKIGSDMGALLEPFGQQLYGFNKEELNYTDMGKRLGDQRNYFAHGDLDKDFIGLSLLDLIFLQRIIYAIQLKISGLEDKQIQRAINDLFQCRFAI